MKHSNDVYSALPHAIDLNVVDLRKQIIEAQNQIVRNEGRTSVMPTHGLDELFRIDTPHTFTLAFGIPPIDPVEARRRYTPKRILRSGRATIVFWADGSKTIVKRAPDEPDNEYQAFCAALAKKIFQSNSKLKKIIKTKTEVQR